MGDYAQEAIYGFSLMCLWQHPGAAGLQQGKEICQSEMA
jgi:hypothetical protein